MKKILFLVFALYLLRIGLSAEADTFSKDVELNLDILDVRESINLRQPTITEDIQLVPPEPQSIEDVTGISKRSLKRRLQTLRKRLLKQSKNSLNLKLR